MLPWARLDVEGFLEMFRNGNWKKQWCPFQSEDIAAGPKECGNWCPLLRDMMNPLIDKVRLADKEIMVMGTGFYLACQGTEKPSFIFTKVWSLADKSKQLDEFGNFKEPSETVGPAVRHLDLED